MKRKLVLVVAPLLLAAACGDDSATSTDGAVVDQAVSVDHGIVPDLGATPDLGRDLQGAPDGGVDAPPVSSDAQGAWPPPTPYHTGKLCSLPPCDPSGAETTDLSGTWTYSVTTNSQTCNLLARAMNKRLQPGNVETVTGQTFIRSGECLYKDKVGGTVTGVIKGNVMISCEVQPVVSGVTPVVESQVTFNGNTGSGTGPAWTYLFDVPVPPASCQANCTIDFTRE
jgi:hypothetical protein